MHREDSMYKNLAQEPIAEVQNAQSDKWDRDDLLKITEDAREGCPDLPAAERRN